MVSPVFKNIDAGMKAELQSHLHHERVLGKKQGRVKCKSDSCEGSFWTYTIVNGLSKSTSSCLLLTYVSP